MKPNHRKLLDRDLTSQNDDNGNDNEDGGDEDCVELPDCELPSQNPHCYSLEM